MKKILLTTILGLGVAFGDRLNLQDMRRGMPQLSLKIQNHIDYILCKSTGFKYHHKDYLKKIFNKLKQNRKKDANSKNNYYSYRMVEKDELLSDLKKIFPDAKYIYYQYNYSGSGLSLTTNKNEVFSILLTPEKLVENENGEPDVENVKHMYFDIDPETFELAAYYGIYNGSEPRHFNSASAFYREFLHKYNPHIDYLSDTSRNIEKAF